MSFNRTASGTAASIREQVSHWREQQDRDDNSNDTLPPETKKAHALQVDAATKIAEAVLVAYPDKAMSIQCSVTDDQKGTGTISVTYRLLRAGETQ